MTNHTSIQHRHLILKVDLSRVSLVVRAATGQVGCGTAGAVQINQFNVTSRRDDPPGCVTVTRSRDSAVGLMHSHRGIILKHAATRDWSSSLSHCHWSALTRLWGKLN